MWLKIMIVIWVTMWHGLFVINYGSNHLKGSWKHDAQSDATFNQSLCALHLLWVNYWLCFSITFRLFLLKLWKTSATLTCSTNWSWSENGFHFVIIQQLKGKGQGRHEVFLLAMSMQRYMLYISLCRCQSISERTSTVVVVGDGTEKNPTWEGRDHRLRYTHELLTKPGI